MAKQKYVPQKQLKRSLEIITETGVRGKTRNELKQLAIPIIREAKKRVRALEAAGLTDSPAYQEYIVQKKMRVSAAGKDTNTLKNEVREAVFFLGTTTSTVKGAREYNEWLDDHLGAFTTKDERTEIWKVVHKFEESHTGHFINFGYDMAIRKIAQVSSLYNYGLNEIIQSEQMMPEDDRVITSKIGEYLSYKGYISIDSLKDFLKSTADRLDIDNSIGEELEKGGRSIWFPGRSSIGGL